MKFLLIILEKKSLKSKLLFGFGFCSLIMLLTGFNTILNIKTLNFQTHSLNKNFLDIGHIKETKIALLSITNDFYQLIQTSPSDPTYLLLERNIWQSLTNIQEEVALVRETSGIDSYEENKKNWIDFDIAFNDYQNNVKTLINSIKNQKEENLILLPKTKEVGDIGNKIETVLSIINDNKQQHLSQTVEYLKQIGEEVIFITLILLLIGLSLMLISSVLISKAILKPIRRLQDAVKNIAAGKLNEVIPYTNDQNEIGSIARTFITLQTASQSIEMQRWVKEHFASISTKLYQVETFDVFAHTFLSAICPILNAGYASFYQCQNNELHVLGSYGHYFTPKEKETILFGQGLVGQCAIEKQSIVLKNVPNNYIKIASSLGESIPSNILVYPVLRVNELLGVIEIALFAPLTNTEKALLDELMPTVAISIEILDRNLKTQVLLAETKTQADNLEIQAVQLEEQAVELGVQQAEIKETEAWFRGIIESAPDAMLVVDADGIIVLCNKRADEIFGYDSGELLWKNVDCLVPLSIKHNHPTMRQKFMQEGGTREMGAKMDLRAIRKDGSDFAVEIGLSKLPVTNNKIFVCVSARDISLKKEAEMILRHAKKIAEDSTQMKSDFLANMSHEIRTPMNAIIGISHLILKTELSKKQHDYITKIQNSSQHLLGIINDILDLSKIEAGKIILEHVDFKIEKVLSNVLNLIADKAKDKDLEIVFDIDKTLPLYLNGDPLRLGQILINYANNAVKFTDEGEIVICVKVLEDNEDDILLHFSVKDTGIGLTPAAIEKLFQDFQQADTSTSRKYGGSGLGLSIAKKLSTLMGGDVGVDSVFGEGSTFWFSARLKKAMSHHLHTMQTKSLQGRRVLVVDDNEISRYELENILSNMGLGVTQVATGEKALKYIAMADNLKEPYELIFLDWYMPVMDGAETAKAIMAMPLTQKPQIIMVTAHGREEVLREIELAGLETVLIKPVNFSLLFDIVTRLLSDKDEAQSNEHALSVSELNDLSEILAEIKYRRGANILVAEDNSLNQEVIEGMLSYEGFNVDIANDGREALYMLDQKNYDLVLMDMQMPVMDGIATTIEIRKQSKFNQLPIIAMTANAMQQDKERCLQAGMNDYVSKPIHPESLYLALLKWIAPVAQDVQNDTPVAISSNQDIALPVIDGLDVNLGLSRVVGKKPLYLSMLKKYVDNQGNVAGALHHAIAQQDFTTAERIAHSARSVNGNIGAMELHDLAQEIELLIRTAAPISQIETKIDLFSVLQTPLIEALKSSLTSTAPVTERTVIDTSTSSAVLNRLIDLLNDDDTDALGFLDYNRELLLFSLGATLFERLENAVNQFHFEQALDLITTKK